MVDALDPNGICPASGLRNATCIRTVCDCFPDEEDRFGLHPERFVVGGAWPPALPIHRTEAGWPRCATCDGGGCYDCTDPA